MIFLPVARCVCRQAAGELTHVLLLDGLARSKQDLINRGNVAHFEAANMAQAIRSENAAFVAGPLSLQYMGREYQTSRWWSCFSSDTLTRRTTSMQEMASQMGSHLVDGIHGSGHVVTVVRVADTLAAAAHQVPILIGEVTLIVGCKAHESFSAADISTDKQRQGGHFNYQDNVTALWMCLANMGMSALWWLLMFC